MSIKKILVSLIAGAVMTTGFAISAMAADAVATLNGTEYDSVQAAVDAAVEGDNVIQLLPGTIDQNVLITQQEGINIHIKGQKGVIYTGRFDINGNSRSYATNPQETVKFEGIYFNGEDATESFKFICSERKYTINGVTNYSYAHNVTVSDCVFVGNFAGGDTYEETVDIGALQNSGGFNWTIENCIASNMHSFMWASYHEGRSTITNVTVTDCESGLSLGTNANYTITNCTFDVIEQAIRADANSDRDVELIVENCTINAGTGFIIRNADTANKEYEVEIKNNKVVSTVADITRAGAAKEGDTIYFTIDNNYWGGDAPVIDELEGFVDEVVPYYTDEEMTEIGGCVAMIGNEPYATLQAAFNAATTDGNVIDLMGNTIIVKDEMFDPINGRRCYDVKAKPVIVKNGTIDLTAANVSDSVFRLENADDAITFENVNFVQNEDAANSMTYFINIHTSGNVVEFIDCEFDIAKVSSFIANTSGGTVLVKDCEATVASGNFLYRGNATVENVTFISETGRFLHANAYPTTIKNSTIVTSEIVFIEPEGTLAVTENSSVKANAVRHYYDSTNAKYKEKVITVDSTSSLEAEALDLALIDTENSEGTIVSKADSIEVQFVKVDVDDAGKDTAEGEDLYNINLVGSNEEIINRLNSADLTFKLTSDHDMAFTIVDIADDNIVVNPVNNSDDRYEFHFGTKTNVENDTANTITIAQVKFEGYGKYDFEIVADAPNAAHATTISDNIVDTFVPGGAAEGMGDLIITNAITDAYIAVPTRNLIINVDFPNSVEEQTIAYNDMKVVVSGGDLAEAITIDLGSDAVETKVVTENDKATAKYVADFVDGAYVVEITDVLTVNNSYNVEVSGAGYRTARYTVRMTDKKTVNFWNNVKDAFADVEKDEMQAKKNFLAGDIVKDNKINTYDLSAVVSYFGETGLSATNNKAYAKYDLNRDGLIDSKDVAIVLVSWGE